MSERKQFTRIEGAFSKTIYIPRAGKIRLGLKVQSAKDSTKTRPKNVDYFVVPEEVAKKFGPEPTELKVMLPTEDETQAFPQRLEWWKAGGLACHGNGKEAQRWDPAQKTWIDRTCPCEHFKDDANPTGECSERAHLLVLIPDVSMGSCYQIDTGSFHGVVNINSMIANVRRLVGRISYVPLVLRRVVRELTREGKREKKAILELALDPSIDNPDGINMLRDQTKRIVDARTRVRIEPPREEAPTAGPVDVIEPDEPAEETKQPPEETIEVPSETIDRPVETVTLGLNPDGAEREKQARLADPPPEREPEVLHHPPPPQPKKAAPPNASDAIWDAWLNGAVQDMDTFERTCKALNVPMGKSINRAVRASFRAKFDELSRKAS